MKDTNVRITRWYLALQPFKFKVVHRSGVQMAEGGGGMWRGGRGKAKRGNGRAGSETSGEAEGN